VTRHLVMTGNPGTGKTTVARLLGEIYSGYGVLASAKVKVVGRHELVAQYIGHTAKQVQEVFDEARGGILFIDEAYDLIKDGSPQDFGHEAVAKLIVLMEDHRDDTIVIAAGYPAPMKKFLGSNPGLEGRFAQTIHFPNYSDGELMEIFRRMCAGRYDLSPSAEAKLGRVVPQVRKALGNKYDNARRARTILGEAIKRHHARVGKLAAAEDRKLTIAELRELHDADIPTAREIVKEDPGGE
jgi:SpoVK/Ycf46/Vps4 family AAA+-type ATPase